MAVEGHKTRTQLCNLIAEGGDQLLLCPLAHVGGADGVHGPMLWLAVRDEGSDADDRVVDVLREFIADRLAHFGVGLADKIVGGCKPAEVGHSLQIPDDDARFHADRSITHSRIFVSYEARADNRTRLSLKTQIGIPYPLAGL